MHIIDDANDDEGNEVAEEDDEEADNIDNDMDTKYGPRTQQYNLRPRKPRDYGHLHATTDGNFNATLECYDPAWNAEGSTRCHHQKTHSTS